MSKASITRLNIISKIMKHKITTNLRITGHQNRHLVRNLPTKTTINITKMTNSASIWKMTRLQKRRFKKSKIMCRRLENNLMPSRSIMIWGIVRRSPREWHWQRVSLKKKNQKLWTQSTKTWKPLRSPKTRSNVKSALMTKVYKNILWQLQKIKEIFSVGLFLIQ